MATSLTSLAETGTDSNWCDKNHNKALNGIANMTTAAVEIPKNIINTTNESNIVYGIVGGLIKGALHTVGRMGVGLVDLLTFPIPTRPIVQPYYVWNDFKVDTSYSELFRINHCPDQEATKIVQTPPAIAPTPAPNTLGTPPLNQQYDDNDVNKKLDHVFQKEMRK
ncbi:MAG: exosortase system-associated protein, TIGR04073 family [Methylococcaceae bacterium]